jgi:hypothetical protein
LAGYFESISPDSKNILPKIAMAALALRVQKVHVHVAIALVQQGYTDDENHEKI